MDCRPGGRPVPGTSPGTRCSLLLSMLSKLIRGHGRHDTATPPGLVGRATGRDGDGSGLSGVRQVYRRASSGRPARRHVQWRRDSAGTYDGVLVVPVLWCPTRTMSRTVGVSAPHDVVVAAITPKSAALPGCAQYLVPRDVLRISRGRPFRLPPGAERATMAHIARAGGAPSRGGCGPVGKGGTCRYRDPGSWSTSARSLPR
jgi:hypothetical protein